MATEGASATPPHGRVIGRYALFGEIAAGGMATVHLGRLLGPVGFSRTVAIKRLHPQFAKDPEFVSMFLDEARLAARIQHPNVVATLDVVALEGELFLVMEYVAGESLSRLVKAAKRAGQRVPPRVVSAILVGMLHGLHAAHEAKSEQGEPLDIVHRDISPQNVLVGADGTSRVLDFGVAKAVARAQTTRDGQMKGKVAYMSPEQLSGEKVDRRTDVFAAGIVLWEALTGERLFAGGDAGEVFGRVLKADISPPSYIVPTLSAAVDAVVLRALARDRDERFATARDFAIALEKAAPIASPRQVGEWVESIGGALLESRADLVAKIESVSSQTDIPRPAAEAAEVSSPSAASAVSVLPTTSDSQVTSPSQVSFTHASRAADRQPRRRSAVAIAIAVCGAVGVGFGAMALLAGGSPEGDAAGTSPAGAIGSEGRASSLSSSAAGVTPRTPSVDEGALVEEEMETVDLDDLKAERIDAASSAPSSRGAGDDVAAPKPPPAPPSYVAPRPKPAAPKSCNPPFYVDDKGIKRPKPECL